VRGVRINALKQPPEVAELADVGGVRI